MRYRKKPVEIEAWDVDDLLHLAAHVWRGLPTQITDAYDRGEIVFGMDEINILTLEGTMIASRGDKVICDVVSELYPCKPDIFAATYEAVDDDQVG